MVCKERENICVKVIGIEVTTTTNLTNSSILRLYVSVYVYKISNSISLSSLRLGTGPCTLIVETML